MSKTDAAKEDYEYVVKYARDRNISVIQAMGHKMVQLVLAHYEEERRYKC